MIAIPMDQTYLEVLRMEFVFLHMLQIVDQFSKP